MYLLFIFIVYDLTRTSGTVFLALLVIAGFNVFYSIFAGILVAIEVSLRH